MNEKPPAMPRQVPFWLVISLMANMMLVGLLGGLLLRPGAPKPVVEHSQERFAWVEKDGEGAPVALVLRKAYQASESEREARVTARKALADAVARDPYDEKAVREAFTALRQADDSVNESTHEAMVQLFAALPVEERAHMARFLMHGPPDAPRMRRMRPGERIMVRKREGGRIEEQVIMPGDEPPPPPDFEP